MSKWKKSIAELGHNGRLKIYVNPSKIYVNPCIKVRFSNMARYIWLKFCLEYKKDLNVDGYQNIKNLEQN